MALLRLSIGLVLASCMVMVSPARVLAAKHFQVSLKTSLGEIVVELENDRAPVTTTNFLGYVRDGFYTNGSFYRSVTTHPDNQPGQSVKIDVIQGGADASRAARSPIKLETTSFTHLKHRDGTLSMARSTPDSATTEFFICVGDQPSLDFGGKRNPDGQGFAAFGHVVRGMELVRKIHELPVDGQSLKPPVKLISASIDN
jgi:peptidyl-prolyl cis-trans isomerase A (cyclophilin A)